MSITLNSKNLTTSSVKQYLQKKGYDITIKVNNRSTKSYRRTFDIKFPDNQELASEIIDTTAKLFPQLAPYNSTNRLLLTDEGIIEVLPLLPTLKERIKSVLVNTPHSAKVNTTEIQGISNMPIRRSRSQVIKENQSALDLLASPDFETRKLSFEEKTILENYAGVGSQYTDDQQNNIDALTQFYTPEFVGERLYEIASEMGFPASGKVLEPSCGVGRLIKHAPDYANVTAFEISAIPYRIAKKLYPQVEIHNLYFEQAFLKAPRYNDLLRPQVTWLKGYPFDLVIGNPPYGKHKNIYQSFFGNPKFPQNRVFLHVLRSQAAQTQWTAHVCDQFQLS